jgi:thiamine pyrophosphokinase
LNAFHTLEIFVNGDAIPVADRPKAAPLSGAVLPTEWLCIVDGGARHVTNRDWKNESVFFIGDGDSIPENLLQKIETSLKQRNRELSIKRLPKEKSLSDLAAALDHIETLPLSENPICAHFQGCKGGRFDHEMTTYLEIVRWVQNRKQETVATFEHGIITNCSTRANLPQNSVFSLLSPQQKSHITVNGALYSGNIELERPTHGISNVALQKMVTIIPHHTTVALFWNFTAEEASK